MDPAISFAIVIYQRQSEMEKVIGYRCIVCRNVSTNIREFIAHAIRHAEKIMQRADGTTYEVDGDVV